MSRIVHTDIWSAYGYAKKAGYEGTEAEFMEGLKKGAEASEHAEESASEAAESASTAESARDNAATSAEAAASSATSAQGYANAAAGSASDAAGSASVASTKAAQAGESEGAAENYAQAAAGSATAAAASAQTAAGSVTDAQAQAQAAAGSASAAAQSVTDAGAQATAAAGSATAAATSAETAAASAASVGETANTSEAWAVGTRGGQAVPSTDPAYHNNSKYWKDQAQAVKDSIPADYSQLNADVTDLKSAISELFEEKYVDITDTITWTVNGYYNNGYLSGNPQNIEESKTAFIDVSGGETLRISGKTYYLQKLFCVYGANDTLLAAYDAQNAVVNYTDEIIVLPDNAVKVAVSYYRPSYLATFKVEKLETDRKPIGKDELFIFDDVSPINYYDYTSAVIGKYINYNNGTTSDNAGMCYAYVPVVSGAYVLTVAQNYFGSVAARVPYFDGDKQYLGYIQGTFISQDIPNLAIVSITVPNGARYITVSLRTNYRYRGMVVKGSTMPTEFALYFDGYNVIENDIKVNADNVIGFDENPLYLKTVAFDGDSICHGISASDDKNGWAGRIGTANGMNWVNFGISGGTITNNHSHCILNSLDNIHTYMPTLDYYIFEGGTNDADRLGIAGIGTVTENDYGGTYDTDTFSGAFETLIYRALTYYPTAKIGYIVAQKMGKTSNANYATRKAYFDRAMEICNKWGIPYIDLWNVSHLNPNLESMYDDTKTPEENIAAGKMYIDGQHLTPNGYAYITPIIETWMRTL